MSRFFVFVGALAAAAQSQGSLSGVARRQPGSEPGDEVNCGDASPGCGSTECASSQEFIRQNGFMQRGMAINYTGDAQVDFAKSMISLNAGAVSMCSVLNQYGNPVHSELSAYCDNLIAVATGEMSYMMVWLIMNAGEYVEASHACGASADDGSSNQPTARRRRRQDSDEDPCIYADGCGAVDAHSSQQYIRLNEDVHASVGIHFTCDANVDFARAMVAHLNAANSLCDVYYSNIPSLSSPDFSLVSHCASNYDTKTDNIILFQQWLRENADGIPGGEGCILVPTAPPITMQSPPQPQTPPQPEASTTRDPQLSGGVAPGSGDDATLDPAALDPVDRYVQSTVGRGNIGRGEEGLRQKAKGSKHGSGKGYGKGKGMGMGKGKKGGISQRSAVKESIAFATVAGLLVACLSVVTLQKYRQIKAKRAFTEQNKLEYAETSALLGLEAAI